MNSLKNLKPDFIRIYPFLPLEESEASDEIKAGRKKMLPVERIIDRTVSLFIEAMKQNIPVIRIGLPVTDNMPDIYPHNLFQVVACKAIERIADKGETEFDLPKEWMTSFFMARRKFPEISVSIL